MRRSVAWLIAICLTAATAPNFASAEEPAVIPRPTPGEALPLQDGLLKLSLAQAVKLAVQRNLDVELLRFAPKIAEEDLGAAWGAYDPQLYGNGGYQNLENPTASQILGNTLLTQEEWAGEAGLQGQFPWLGGTYQIGYTGSEVVTNSQISLLSPEFRAGFTATVRMPLLQGLFWNDSWTQVRLGRIGVDASRDKFQSELMDVVQRTEDIYWGLIAAQDSTRVAEKSLETAQALLSQTQAQYEVGVVSRVEVVQAEAGVADREFKLIRAQALERNAQDALVDTVLGPYLEPESEITVEPTDRPDEMSVRAVSAAAATEHAMARRPEIQLARKDIERRKVELKSASNKRLPQLDVVGSYGKSGLAGRASPDCANLITQASCADPPGIPPTWRAADDDFFNGRSAESYTVQGVLTMPLGNNTARHQYGRAQFELRRSETALVRLEQSIVSEIRRAARNLMASVQGIEAANRAEAAATEQLRAEHVRLEHGESTPFDVLLREQDLVQAQSQKILAQNAYHSSITGLDRAQGTILERNQIVVEDAATLR
jgi:outer membrane protein TolC